MLPLGTASAQSRARGKVGCKVVEASVFVIKRTDVDWLRGVDLAAIRSSGGWKCAVHVAQVPRISRW